MSLVSLQVEQSDLDSVRVAYQSGLIVDLRVAVQRLLNLEDKETEPMTFIGFVIKAADENHVTLGLCNCATVLRRITLQGKDTLGIVIHLPVARAEGQTQSLADMPVVQPLAQYESEGQAVQGVLPAL